MTTTPAPTDLDVLRKLAHTAQDWAEYGHPSDPNWHGARTLIKTVPALLDELAKTRAELDDADAALRRLGDQANHLVQQLDAASMVRQRIAEAHRKHVDGHGGTWGECNECGNGWPCPTYVWATTNRDPLATWDPADDAPPVASTADKQGADGAAVCGQIYVGDEGEFACTLYAHDAQAKHWNSLAEFAWTGNTTAS